MPLSRAAALLQGGHAARALLLLDAVPPPHDARHAFLRGACAHQLGDLAGAIDSFRTALSRDPAHAQAACALATLLLEDGRAGEAETVLGAVLQNGGTDPQLRFNLAVALEQQEKLSAAEEIYDQLLLQYPRHYAARLNRAGLHVRQGRPEAALRDCRELTEQYPQESTAWLRLGDIAVAGGHYDEAIAAFETASWHDPANGPMLAGLAGALAACGRLAESRQVLERLRQHDLSRWETARQQLNGQRGNALDIDPRLIFLRRGADDLEAGDWRYWARWCETLRDHVASPSGGDTLPLAWPSLLAPLTAPEQCRFMAGIAGQAAQRAAAFSLPRLVGPTPSRLRVGYIGPLLGELHVTRLNLQPLFDAHDPAVVDVFVIACGATTTPAAEAPRMLRPGLWYWHPGALSDADIVAGLAALKLDVLVDVATYSNRARPEILAARPAPVQVAWMGAPYSSGGHHHDYFISDARVRPPDEDGERWCSEAEVLMPHSYFCFGQGLAPAATPSRSALGLPEDAFVFANLGNPGKLTPEVFACWMRVLTACPGSLLWLLQGLPALADNLRREATRQGVNPARLVFAERIPSLAHRARQGAADLFLDTWPHGGHTTLAESLVAGTPAISLPGATFASRVGASLLHDAGLPELVAASQADYEALAIALHRDRLRLDALRQCLVGKRPHFHFTDMAGQARALEAAYRHMCERLAEGLAPVGFDIAPLLENTPPNGHESHVTENPC